MNLSSLLLENLSYKVSYSGVVLDKSSKEKILSNVDTPKGWKVYAHHMTICLGELPENLKDLKGKKQTLKITKLGKSDKAIAFGVETDLSKNKIPHITVAINTSIGAKPKDSNEIQEWEDIEPFTVVGYVDEVLVQQPFKVNGNPSVLNVFDFDGTLMNSPTPEEGIPIYKKITGKDWPHRGWWGQIESLSVFDVKPILKTNKLYNEYTSIPNSVSILMTNRIPKFESVVREKLKDYYIFDYYDFKNDHREKPDRILEILKLNPSIKTINIFDDMDEQIARFEMFKKQHPTLKINIYQI
jgi:hypothetical protein